MKDTRILARTGKIEMGQYSSALLARADLGTGVIVAAFHSEGHWDVLRQKLKRLHKLLLIAGAVSFRTLALIISTPIALVGSSLDSAAATSSSSIRLN